MRAVSRASAGCEAVLPPVPVDGTSARSKSIRESQNVALVAVAARSVSNRIDKHARKAAYKQKQVCIRRAHIVTRFDQTETSRHATMQQNLNFENHARNNRNQAKRQTGKRFVSASLGVGRKCQPDSNSTRQQGALETCDVTFNIFERTAARKIVDCEKKILFCRSSILLISALPSDAPACLQKHSRWLSNSKWETRSK